MTQISWWNAVSWEQLRSRLVKFLLGHLFWQVNLLHVAQVFKEANTNAIAWTAVVRAEVEMFGSWCGLYSSHDLYLVAAKGFLLLWSFDKIHIYHPSVTGGVICLRWSRNKKWKL